MSLTKAEGTTQVSLQIAVRFGSVYPLHDCRTRKNSQKIPNESSEWLQVKNKMMWSEVPPGLEHGRV